MYRRIVLAVNGAPTDHLVVQFGAELSARQAELIALHVVEVDWSHDLSEDLASTDERASAVLDMAEAVAEKHGVVVRTELLQARDIAAALVDETAEVGADLLVVGLPYRQRFGGDFALGEVIPYIFQNAPCTVLVVREPVTEPEGRRPEPAAISYAGTR